MSQRVGDTERAFYVELGRRMAEHRRRKSVGQAAVALECGGTDSLISHFESGRARPSLYQLTRIAPAIGTTVADLLGVDRVSRDDEIEALRRRCDEAHQAHAHSFSALVAIALLLNQDGVDDYQDVVRGVEALIAVRDACVETLTEITVGVVGVLERRARPEGEKELLWPVFERIEAMQRVSSTPAPERT